MGGTWLQYVDKEEVPGMAGLQLRVLSTFFCLSGFSSAFRRNLGPDKGLRSYCPVPGQPRNPPERQSSRLLCPIGFFSAHFLQVCSLRAQGEHLAPAGVGTGLLPQKHSKDKKEESQEGGLPPRKPRKI